MKTTKFGLSAILSLTDAIISICEHCDGPVMADVSLKSSIVIAEIKSP